MLNERQIANTLEDLFGLGALAAASLPLSTLPAEVFDEVTHERQSTVSVAKVDAYFGIARAVAEHVATDDDQMREVFGECMLQSSADGSCLQTYLDGFAMRLARRPLTQAERSATLELFEAAAGTPRDRAEAVLTYHLASPSHLWRLQLGTGEVQDGDLALTQFEVATRLAYTLTDSTPDPELLDRARRGELGTLEAMADEARRLIRTPRGRAKLVAAIARWSANDRTAELDNLPDEILADLNVAALPDVMLEEALYFIETMVFERNATFEELLTSPLSFAQDSDLAALYGHSPATADAPARFEGRRRGLLLRAPALSSASPRANLILRGVDLQLRILCNEIPEPNVDIAAAREESAPTKEEEARMSTRDVVAATTAAPDCQLCHSIINPTGFVFERFDSIGRLRTEEKLFDESGEWIDTVDVDASSTVPMPHSGPVEASDAYDFVGFVAESPEGKACFVRNMFRYLTETRESDRDACAFRDAAPSLLASDTPIVDLVVDALVHDAFRVKRLAGS